MVVRRRQAEQRLEQAVDVGAVEQVAAADDVGDTQSGVVDGDGQMIARRRVLAGEDDVAEQAGLGHHLAGDPARTAGPPASIAPCDVETPGVRPFGRQPLGASSAESARQVPG